MIGKTLGHYQITNQLGKGGMGEVFQARDQKLARDVAIKVLPKEFARDADRAARFQREAKVLASLNHPNIAAIHGLEESEGTNFLVLELVEGQTLADRVKAGPIPVEESMKLALQIAEALEAAHEKGVIHRDLKPANIKVTPDGKVKVLDFGLAKAFAGDREEVNLSNSPTLSDAATQQGVILGTAAYMSPEQARGKAVDKRADIWALGCVLYEMLTGKQTFSGATVTDIIAATLAKEPDFSRLPANIQPDIRKLLNRCLQKDPAERFRDVGDVRVEIKQILADPGGVLVQPGTAAEPRRKLRTVLPWAAATLVLGLIIVGLVVWNLRKAEPPRVTRFTYELPESQQFNIRPATIGHTLAVSPDGNQFVYSTGKGLYMRSVGELNAAIIAGTEEDPQSPFFSPDGQWIGYWAQAARKLKKISIRGGAPVALCDVTWVYGAIWYPDDKIICSDVPKGVIRVSANGGTPETLVKGYTVAPQLMPDGKSLIFTDVSKQPYRIVLQSLKSGERKELFAGIGSYYLPSGHLTYRLQNNNNLFAVAFDPRTGEVKGGAVPIVEGASFYAISNSGTLTYIPQAGSGSAQPGRALVWVNREGKEEPLGTPPNEYRFPKVSPDGTRVALTASIDGNQDVWIWDIVRKALTRLTFDKANDLQSIWTPDGKRIVFASNRAGRLFSLFWKAADGTGTEEKLGSAPDLALLPWSWSGDGKTLITTETDLSQKWDIGMFSMEGDRTRKPLLHEDPTEINPKISTDGRYVAYQSMESGKMQVYVRPFPEIDKGKWQVSTDGGMSPLWSPDGRELFYLTEENTVMAAAVETKQALSFGTPKTLFRGNFINGVGEGTAWDIHPDGKRFLVMKPPGAPPSTEAAPRSTINVVLNWLEDLKQRVPVK